MRGAKAGQRLPDGEEYLLGQVLAQRRIRLVGHGDARDQRAMLGHDPFERGRFAVKDARRRRLRLLFARRPHRVTQSLR